MLVRRCPDCDAFLGPEDPACDACGLDLTTRDVDDRDTLPPRRTAPRHTPITGSYPPPVLATASDSKWSLFFAGVGMGLSIVLAAGMLVAHVRGEVPAVEDKGAATCGPDASSWEAPGERSLGAQSGAPRGSTREVKHSVSLGRAHSPRSSAQTDSVGVEVRADRNSIAEADAPADGALAEAFEVEVPGRVVSSSQLQVRVGIPCEIAASVRGAEIARATLTCADQDLYDSEAAPRDVLRETEAYEVPGVADGAFAYRLTYRDDGDTSEVARMSFDTFHQRAVLRDGKHGEVIIRLGSQSLDLPGPARFGLPRPVFNLRRALRKLEASGSYPLPLARPCSLEAKVVMASPGGLTCSAHLKCRGRTLYGSNGSPALGACEVDDSQIIRFEDDAGSEQDGSPMLSLGLADGDVHLSDDARARPYRVVFGPAY